MKSSLLLALLVSLSVAVLFGCPIPDTCPCVRRGTFDSASLNATNPALALQYKAYKFSTPNITYPDCTAIYSTCPSGSQVAKILQGVITIGGKTLQNPFVISGIICDSNHNWIMDGVNEPLDANIKASNISCATKI